MIAWPDVDGFQEWTDKLARFSSSPGVTPGLTRRLDVTVSPLLQQVASPEDYAAHIDIADWLIREKSVMPGSKGAVKGLIDDLDLEFFGAEKVIEETSDEVPE